MLNKSFLLILILFTIIYFINYFYLRSKDDIIIDNNELMNNTMASILIIFGGFKLINLKKFSSIFSRYNLISKNIPFYSYLYPFIEIILGFLLFYKIRFIYYLIIVLMIISLISVSITLYMGKNLRCGCLGSFFNLPLSYVTIFENLVMLLMSSYQIIQFYF